METDRELLEFAAKASGLDGYFASDDQSERDEYWDPLTNDGDAFRLLVELCITIKYGSGYVYASHSTFRTCFAEPLNKGKESAIRLAIVRVAAEIGRKKNEASNGN